jgi:hypothetical protein
MRIGLAEAHQTLLLAELFAGDNSQLSHARLYIYLRYIHKLEPPRVTPTAHFREIAKPNLDALVLGQCVLTVALCTLSRVTKTLNGC